MQTTDRKFARKWPLVSSSSVVPVPSLVPSEPLDDSAFNQLSKWSLVIVSSWCKGFSWCGSWMSASCLETWRSYPAQLEIVLTFLIPLSLLSLTDSFSDFTPIESFPMPLVAQATIPLPLPWMNIAGSHQKKPLDSHAHPPTASASSYSKSTLSRYVVVPLCAKKYQARSDL